MERGLQFAWKRQEAEERRGAVENQSDRGGALGDADGHREFFQITSEEDLFRIHTSATVALKICLANKSQVNTGSKRHVVA